MIERRPIRFMNSAAFIASIANPGPTQVTEQDPVLVEIAEKLKRPLGRLFALGITGAELRTSSASRLIARVAELERQELEQGIREPAAPRVFESTKIVQYE